MEDWGFYKKDVKLFKRLNTPKKIQDFINSLKMNFEEKGDSCMSPKMVLKTRKAHCIEGALLASTILRFHGHKPLIVDLETVERDDDHVIAIFKKNGFYGSISKTNHSVLRYREPVYKNIRELVMSFFHEYFYNDGKKTLRAFSKPVNLARFDGRGWMVLEDDVWFIPEHLTKIPHTKILTRSQIAGLRKVEKIEIDAGDLKEYKKH